jgi:hypothetical protein
LYAWRHEEEETRIGREAKSIELRLEKYVTKEYPHSDKKTGTKEKAIFGIKKEKQKKHFKRRTN